MKKFHTGKAYPYAFMPGFFIWYHLYKFYSETVCRNLRFSATIFTAVFTDQDRCTGIYLVSFKGKSDSVCSSSWAGIYKNEKNDCVAFCNLTGISGGILLSIAVTELGIRGSIFCLLGIFPQFLFYIPAFLIVLSYCWMYPKSRWSREKNIMSVGMLLSGMIMETYVNSVFAACFSEKKF